MQDGRDEFQALHGHCLDSLFHLEFSGGTNSIKNTQHSDRGRGGVGEGDREGIRAKIHANLIDCDSGRENRICCISNLRWFTSMIASTHFDNIFGDSRDRRLYKYYLRQKNVNYVSVEHIENSLVPTNLIPLRHNGQIKKSTFFYPKI